MLVKTNDRVLIVAFHHTSRFTEEIDGEQYEYFVNIDHVKNVRGMTECFIKELNDKKESKLIASGRAYCSRKDRYLKETGRQIALQRAIDDKSITVEEEGKLLNAYYSRHRIAHEKAALRKATSKSKQVETASAESAS